MLDNATWWPRLSPSQLRPGTHYYLVLSGGVELRFGDPRPDAVRIDVIAVGSTLVEEARTVCHIGRHGHPVRPVPPGRGWRVHDASHSSFTIWQRKPQENPP
jgi:hypothetical protein